MVNCGHQRVVGLKRNFVVLSDSDLKKVLRKALEKLVIFDKLITFNIKTLEMYHQDGCRLIIEVSLRLSLKELHDRQNHSFSLKSATQMKEISLRNY